MATSEPSPPPFPFHYDIEVDLPSPRHAEIARAALAVDKEPRPAAAKKTLIVNGSRLEIHVEAVDARTLRAASSSLWDYLAVVCETFATFPFPS
mmetsp:Transcript_8630/g.21465  ORF Transcript_8630/g.21465 Transcript_8630/m.21465 type:complete len:94 (+) Transcript_8630:95-376(+)